MVEWHSVTLKKSPVTFDVVVKATNMYFDTNLTTALLLEFVLVSNMYESITVGVYMCLLIIVPVLARLHHEPASLPGHLDPELTLRGSESTPNTQPTSITNHK